MEILRIGILKIKFERNWNFENYLRIGVLEIKFERNWNFNMKSDRGGAQKAF